MNIHEVPQDKKNFKDGQNAPKRVIYATNDQGEYTQTQSDGWEAENIALEQAWEDIDMQLEEAKQQMLRKEKSPIYYFMLKNRMDISILASYVGKWKWQVKRHFKYSVFKNLSTKTLQKYAQVFNISIEELNTKY